MIFLFRLVGYGLVPWSQGNTKKTLGFCKEASPAREYESSIVWPGEYLAIGKTISSKNALEITEETLFQKAAMSLGYPRCV